MIPSHWYIERTIENFKIVNKYFNEGVGCRNYTASHGRLYFPNHLNYIGFLDGNHGDFPKSDVGHYKEITFEEFNQYILLAPIVATNYSPLILNL